MVIMIGLETKVYIREFRWYVRFGVAYTLVGDAVLLNLILKLKDFYERSVFHVFHIFCFFIVPLIMDN